MRVLYFSEKRIILLLHNLEFQVIVLINEHLVDVKIFIRGLKFSQSFGSFFSNRYKTVHSFPHILKNSIPVSMSLHVVTTCYCVIIR